MHGMGSQSMDHGKWSQETKCASPAYLGPQRGSVTGHSGEKSGTPLLGPFAGESQIGLSFGNDFGRWLETIPDERGLGLVGPGLFTLNKNEAPYFGLNASRTMHQLAHRQLDPSPNQRAFHSRKREAKRGAGKMGRAIWAALKAVGGWAGLALLAGAIGAGIGLGAVVILSFFGI